MRDRSNSREKAETVRKRGFGLSRPVFCIALSLTLVIGCIPHDDPITSAKADALVPVAVGAGAAVATALGISETELVLGIMAFLGAGVAMQVSFDDMYNSLDASTGEIDLESYNTNYVDWREKGIDLPSWGDLDATQRNRWGWAWKYDEAVWLGYWMKYVGLNPNGEPNNPNNNNNDNKKWNTLKALAKSGTPVAVAELAAMNLYNLEKNLFGVGYNDSVGLRAYDVRYANGKELPYMYFGGHMTTYYNDGSVAIDRNIEPYSWWLGCEQLIISGTDAYKIQVNYYNFDDYQIDNPVEFRVKETSDDQAWEIILRGTSVRNWGQAQYDYTTNTWTNSSGGATNQGANHKLGHNYTYQGGNVVTDYYYFLNPAYVGGYRFTDSDGNNITPVVTRDVQYGQYEDFPQEQAQNYFDGNPYNYNNYWNTLVSNDPDKTVTIVNPYYQGNLNPTWEDFIQETPNEQVFPVPDTTPDDEPFPETQPETPTEPDYDDRLRGIAELAFSQAFPFCLINDIKLLSDKFVEAGSANPDFSVDIPLEDFGIEGVEVLTLDANHPSTGGGLLELGDYTRPLITIVFIGILLGFSIKLFLR